jgi:hypothetical protein
VEGANASDRWLKVTKTLLVDEFNARDAVGLRPREELIEATKLPFVRRDYNLSAPLVRNCILVTICIESPASFDAEPRLQRPRRVVDPGVNYAAVVSGLVYPGCRLFLENNDPKSGIPKESLSCDGQTEDSSADDDEIRRVNTRTRCSRHGQTIIDHLSAPAVRVGFAPSPTSPLPRPFASRSGS